jgi:conjugative transfer pilus assembly protein TraH
MKMPLSASIAATLIFCSIYASEPRAGFLQDFYDEAGKQSAFTSAGIYSSETMDTLTGGRYIVKTPRKDFQPFYMQAPHLKAGCGGIDAFLGAFSVPSKEEFVSFLRSIGTALPGLAFHLALQSLAPDLNEQVAQFRDMLMRMSREMGDSCQAAQSVLDASGASAWLTGLGHRATNALRASGAAEDQSDALLMTKTDGAKVFASFPDRRDSGNNALETSEMNLTWALLKGGKSTKGLDDSQREAMMSLVGTTIFVKKGSGSETTVEQRTLPGVVLIEALLGDDSSPMLPSDAYVYRCDTSEKCLNPSRRHAEDINLTYAIFQAMLRVRNSLRERNPSLAREQDYQLLSAISPLPLLRLVELSASPRLIGFSDAYLQIFAQAAAYDALLSALSQMSDDIRIAATSAPARNANSIVLKHAELIERRLAELTADLRARESVIAERMSRVNAFLTEIEHISKAVYGDTALDALSGIPSAK